MTDGVIAPQFGIFRVFATHQVEDPATVLPVPRRSSPTNEGPTVIVKRRRHIEAPAQQDFDQRTPAAEHKESKVFLLRADRALGQLAVEQRPSPEVPPAEQAASALPAAMPRMRRRRDPHKAPTLLQHVVFERSEPDACDADELLDLSAPRGYRELNQALTQLRKTLAHLIEGRRILEQLRASRGDAGAVQIRSW